MHGRASPSRRRVLLAGVEPSIRNRSRCPPRGKIRQAPAFVTRGWTVHASPARDARVERARLSRGARRRGMPLRSVRLRTRPTASIGGVAFVRVAPDTHGRTTSAQTCARSHVDSTRARSLSGTAAIDDGELSLGGAARERARGGVRDAARRLLRGDDPRAGARVSRGGAGRAHRLRDEGVRERRAAAAARGGRRRRRRLDARRARVRAGGGDPRRAARLPRQQQVGRGAARGGGGGRARRARRARRGAGGGSSRREARHRAADAGRRGGDAPLDPDGARGVEVRPLPGSSRRARSARALALGLAVEGVHIHIGSQLGRVDESLARARARPHLLPRDSTGRRATSTSAAGSACGTTATSRSRRWPSSSARSSSACRKA